MLTSALLPVTDTILTVDPSNVLCRSISFMNIAKADPQSSTRCHLSMAISFAAAARIVRSTYFIPHGAVVLSSFVVVALPKSA